MNNYINLKDFVGQQKLCYLHIGGTWNDLCSIFEIKVFVSNFMRMYVTPRRICDRHSFLLCGLIQNYFDLSLLVRLFAWCLSMCFSAQPIGYIFFSAIIWWHAISTNFIENELDRTNSCHLTLHFDKAVIWRNFAIWKICRRESLSSDIQNRCEKFGSDGLNTF